MSGFLPEEKMGNPGAGDPWKKGERDLALNDYYNGGHPGQIGIKYKGSRIAFQNSIHNKLKSDYEGKLSRYEPTKLREDRTGKRWTPNEILDVRFQQQKKIPITLTAKLIQRPVAEIEKMLARKPSTADPDYKQKKAVAKTETKLRVSDIRKMVTGLDLIWALRYAHTASGYTPIVTDEEYDALVIDECEYGTSAQEFKKIKAQGYPQYIKCLAEYLSSKKEGK